MDPVTRANRGAWEAASRKYVREYDELLAEAAAGSSLTDAERGLLREILRREPEVVHLQSGNGLDGIALVRAGAKSVVGVDYSEVAAGEIVSLTEYPEPFWRMGGVSAAAWDGRLPNSFALLARRKTQSA